MGYIGFMSLVQEAHQVITDSGGLLEENTVFNIPCLTLQENTGRPIKLTLKTNRLVRPENICKRVSQVLAGQWPSGAWSEFWYGPTAKRQDAGLPK